MSGRNRGLTGHRLGRLSRLFSLLILLLAVVPNLTYAGHWSLFGLTDDHAAVDSAAKAEEHAAHCHTGPATCLSPGPGPAIIHTPQPQFPAALDAPLLDAVPGPRLAAVQAPVFHLTPPPRSA